MANYVITLEGQDKNCTSTIDGVKQSLQGLTKSISPLDNLKKKFEQISNSTMRATQMSRQFQRLLKDGAAAGVAKSDLDALKREMARVTGETQRTERGFRTLTGVYSSKTPSIDAASTAFQGLSAVASVATSAIALFGDENSKTTQKAQQTVNACLTLAVGAQGLATALQGAKAAQLALTRAFSTNPYALAIGAVIALGSAIYGLVSKYNSSKNAANSAAKQQEVFRRVTRQAAQDLRNKISEAISDAVTKYHQLRLSYIQCKNEHQKREWITQYGGECQKLGLKISGISDAENAFVNNTNSTVKAIMARAIALGGYAQASKLFGEAAAESYNPRFLAATSLAGTTRDEQRKTRAFQEAKKEATILAAKYNNSTDIDSLAFELLYKPKYQK